MEEKKKGFFASLFAPKPCKCSCGVQIEEVAEDENPIKDLKKEEEKTSKENDADKDQNTTCCCG